MVCKRLRFYKCKQQFFRYGWFWCTVYRTKNTGICIPGHIPDANKLHAKQCKTKPIGYSTCDETVRSDGNRNSNFPKRVGWLGYWVRQYSSKAHWDFSCNDSICAISDRPHASKGKKKKQFHLVSICLKREWWIVNC